MESGFDHNTGIPGILEESRELRSKSEINIARSLVIPRDGLTLVRIANFSDRPIRLRADLPIVEYHPVSSGDVHRSPIQIPRASLRHLAWFIDRPGMTGEKPKGGLSEDQRDQFLSLVTEDEDIFAKENSDLGKSGLLEHAIYTGDCKPVKQPPRRVPPHQREVIDQQLEDQLTAGRIEPSQSPWSSPVVLARKHDGTYRMCIDYHKLNQLTTKDAIPLHCPGQMTF